MVDQTIYGLKIVIKLLRTNSSIIKYQLYVIKTRKIYGR